MKLQKVGGMLLIFLLILQVSACTNTIGSPSTETEETVKDNDTLQTIAADSKQQETSRQIIDSGTCGENLSWILYDDGRLYISGSGEMYEYDSAQYKDNYSPWHDYDVREKIQYVSIGEGVTTIGSSAFFDCSNIIDVDIPDTVAYIGNTAFASCTNLICVEIPYGVTTLEGTFQHCSSLTSVTLPDSMTSIGFYTFAECSNLTNITIPNSLTNIGDLAFVGCTNLTTFTIPENCEIGTGVFNGCPNLSLKINSNLSFSSNKYAPFSSASFKTVEFGDTVTKIGDYVFYECETLTNVTIPSSVTSIGEHAFDSCKSLTSITIPDNVTDIGYFAFGRCSNLIKVEILNSLTRINHYAFEHCTNLTDVYFTGTESQWTALDVFVNKAIVHFKEN